MKTVSRNTPTIVILTLVLLTGVFDVKRAKAADAALKADSVDSQLRAVISKYVSHPTEVEKLMPKARAVRRQTVDKLRVFTDAWFIGKLDSMVASYVGRGTPAPAVVHIALDSLVATAAVLSARRGQQSGRSDKRQPRTEVGRANRGDGAAALRKQASVKNGSRSGEPRRGLTLDLGKGVTMKLVLIPAGKFLMGSTKTETGRNDDEGPQREVTISKSFYIGAYEVTQAHWYAVMGTKPWNGKSNAKSGSDNAANFITWNDASKFCLALSKKTGRKVVLPTEAQWEYACRAGSKAAYYYGDDGSVLSDYAWYYDNAGKMVCQNDRGDRAHAVGQKRPNTWGLYDMHGNVGEWCCDWYDEDFYANAKNVDPVNSTKAKARVFRGGSYIHTARIGGSCRSAERGSLDARGHLIQLLGLRVVIPANLPTKTKIKSAIQSNATTISAGRETAAAKKLKLANLYISNDKLALAGKIVLEIIEKYPETKVAAEAQTLLKSVSAGLKRKP